MNAKNTSKHTSDNAEVFVLPPNLLEKLGIKLDNIQSTESNSSELKNTIETAVNNVGGYQNNDKTANVYTDNLYNKESESSILETASLMKESVFLSPTFVPTVANVIAGEVEIAKQCSNNIENPIQEQEHINGFLEEFNSVHESMNIANSQSICEPLPNTREQDTCFSDMKEDFDYNKISDIVETYNVNGQESQEYSNSESQNISSKPIGTQENRKNKINIINDEIIDISKINELLNFDNNNVLTAMTVGMLLPPKKAHANAVVSVNGVNSRQSKSDKLDRKGKNVEENAESETVCGYVEHGCNDTDSYNANTTQSSTKSNCEDSAWDATVCNKKNDIDVSPNVSKSNTVAEDVKKIPTHFKHDISSKLPVECLDNVQDHYLLDCSALSNEVNNSQKNLPLDMSTEVDLKSQINDLDKLTESYNTDEHNMHGCYVDMNTTVILPPDYSNKRNHSENSPILSKLCIQGVEKPGGQNPLKHSSVKVYYNRKKDNTQENKQEMNSLVIINNEKPTKCAKDLALNDLNLSTELSDTNIVNINSQFKNTQYCICSDFGQLRYYDEDCFYEHIHFSQNKNVSCDCDIFFSMYIDDIVINEHDDEVTVEIMEETHEESYQMICCYDIFVENENEVPKHFHKVRESTASEKEILRSHEIIENSKLVGTNLTDAEKAEKSIEGTKSTDKVVKEEDFNTTQGRKRKRSINPEESPLGGTDEPLRKGDVKCGVCGQILARPDWEEHADKEHGFIAWKAGDNFDIEDYELLIKIKQKLKEDGLLKCYFCNSYIYCSEEYISHIKYCLKNKSCISFGTQDTSTSSDMGSKRTTRLSKFVTCGVCDRDVESSDWIVHIQQEHNYIAWKRGELPLDMDDKSQILKHLRNIVVGHGALICLKCKNSRQYGIKSIKTYLKHIKSCNEGTHIVMDSSDKMDIEAVNASNFPMEETTLSPGIKNICSNSPEKVETITSSQLHKEKSLRRHSVQKSSNTTDDTSNLNEKALNKGTESSEEITTHIVAKADIVKCGVCKQEVTDDDWIEHIKNVHNYLAWKEGENPLDVKDKNEVWWHLYSITKKCNGLACPKCGCIRKYVKAYLSHIKQCDGMNHSNVADSSIDDDVKNTVGCTLAPTAVIKTAKRVYSNKKKEGIDSELTAKEAAAKCGVCKADIDEKHWYDHMWKAHDYIAWKEGEHSIDAQDQNQVWQHLHIISNKYDGFVCSKCGVNRRLVKDYLSHIEQCNGLDINTEANSSTIDIETKFATLVQDKNVKCDSSKEIPLWKEKSTKGSDSTPIKVDKDKHVKCGVCKHEMADSCWNDHIQREHNYLAWKEGEKSIDLQDKEQVWQHLHSISKKCDGLVCAKCGLNRKYVKAYLSHTKQCDGLNTSIEAVSSKTIDINIATTSTPPVERRNARSRVSSREVNTDPLKSSSDKKVDIKTETTSEEISVKCGVCKLEVIESGWYDHMRQDHNYLTWKEGESALDLQDEEEVRKHLYLISKSYDGLVCSKCGLNRKYVKSYLGHIKHCDGTVLNNDSLLSSSMDTSCISEANTPQSEKEVKCGVCSESCPNKQWFEHIQTKHDYLAWKEGEPELNLQDQIAIENHLRGIVKEHGYIHCQKCSADSKYGPRGVSKYLRHIETCGKEGNDIDEEIVEEESEKVIVKCGVCEQDVEGSRWFEHIGSQHSYLAWKKGKKPLDLEDAEAVKSHFIKLMKKVDAFKCSKCGIQKKYAKVFIDHMNSCTASAVVVDLSRLSSSGLTECAVCSEKLDVKEWKSHAMEKHYNLAWRVGDFPVDFKSINCVEKILKEYKRIVGELVCKNCGISRVSPIGFYAHIVICGKTEEELEKYQNLCEICNKKYVCVYKNQHMAAHREQEYNKERKMKLEEREQNEESEEASATIDFTGDENKHVGRRKAAVKAMGVIEKLKIPIDEDNKTCGTCGFTGSTAKKFARHKCVVETFESGTDTDESYESIASSKCEDSAVEAVESEEEAKDDSVSRKRYSVVAARTPKVPFQYNKLNCYLKQSEEDFFKVHFSDEILFPEWLEAEYEFLEDSQVTDYYPKMEQSCKIKLDETWDTFNRFQVKKYCEGSIMFVGGVIKCLSWIPPRQNEECKKYLAISCHLDTDTPRCNFDELSSHKGIIQIWDYDNFNVLPKLVLCVVHDYGTVWAMDWCPSGARGPQPTDDANSRLGLLAVACSNGFVYIFSVPYPSIVESDKMFCKLKPVAELRISMSSDRRIYQATSLSWSKQKGHAIIMVGYADGTTALYDLCSTSPLLKSTENGVTVFYPYHDKRDHNVCITDVDICASSDLSRGAQVGALCSASMACVTSQLRPGCGQPNVVLRSPSSICKFMPGWPTVLVAADDTLAAKAPNELDWYGCARRLGPVRALGGCQWCGRVGLYTRPVLWHVDALPPYREVKRQAVANIKTSPLAKKRKLANDDLAMLVEPLTYDEVVTQYGVEIELIDSEKNTTALTKLFEPFTERFPLADVTSLAFCPTSRHHRLAAAGLHAGFVLLLTV